MVQDTLASGIGTGGGQVVDHMVVLDGGGWYNGGDQPGE